VGGGVNAFWPVKLFAVQQLEIKVRAYVQQAYGKSAVAGRITLRTHSTRISQEGRSA
jgi:hypothetical protein